MKGCLKSYRVASQSLILIPKSIQNRAYRKFVAGFPCCACGQNWWIDPAHTGPRGRGQKASDLDCIPLCRKCHEQYHQGHADFLSQHSLDLRTIITDLQTKAVACGIDLLADDTPRKRPGRAGWLRKRGVA